MGQAQPTPLCSTKLECSWIDQGTMCVSRSSAPGPIGLGRLTLSTQDKIAEAIRRSLPLLPSEARHQVEAMLTPTSLAIIAGTLVVWAGSHFFGAGEIVDIILLGVGFFTVGLSVFSGAQELYRFATTAVNAQTDSDLNQAAQHFAAAVNILGIAVISAVLLHQSSKAVVARGRPQFQEMPKVGTPPPPGVKPTITRPFRLPNGALGSTDAWGNIRVARNQTLTEQQLTLYHEWVHRILSPRFGPLRTLRAQVRMSAYKRSALMQYVEEALAESYAQLRVYGLQNILVGIRFPLGGGYITVSQLATEGVAIGNIVIGGAQFTVRVVVED
jgi:hypothetical protein